VSIAVRPPCDEAVIQAKDEAAPCSKSVETWVLVATILGSSMSFIDGTVVNVALPLLQADLKANVADVQWVIEAYSLFLSALILVGGSLGDRYGRRRIFGLGVVLFTLASVVCGLAQNPLELILARAVQGVGGALLVPGSLAIISASFTEDKRGKAIGTWSGFSAITAGVGPLLGGLLIDHVSWRAIFFINVPIAVVVMMVLYRWVPESRDASRARLDLIGAVLATGGLGGLTYGLIQSTSTSFSDPLVVTGLAVGALLLLVFVFAETRVSTPMMPLDLFRSRTFSGANLLTVFLYGALAAVMFFVPFTLIKVHGYSATAAGAAFLPFIMIMFLGSRWTGGLVGRFGGKLPLVIGPIVAGVGLGLYAVPGLDGNYWTTFFPAAVVLGVGMTIAVAPLTTVVMGAVEATHAGVASGINNTASRCAGLIAIAGLSIAVVQAFGRKLDGRLSALHVSSPVRHALDSQKNKLLDVQIPSQVPQSLRSSIHSAIEQSFLSGFRLATAIGVGMTVCSALTAWLMIDGKAEAPRRSPAADSQQLEPSRK
jgi:EmrB/QacA subfamily drug resistance transporter